MPDIVLLLSGVVLSWALTGLAVRSLSARRHVSGENERSLHHGDVPVGGGLAIVIVIAALWSLGAAALDSMQVAVVSAAAILSVTHWINDLKSLWPITRLALQALAVAVALSMLPDSMRLLPVLSLEMERVLTAAGWLWFINLFNFMDGIDGLAGGEAVAIAAGYLAVTAMTRQSGPYVILAIAIAGACLGYLIWNWQPARIFMGDAGSIPLGFLTGFLLIDLAYKGQIAAALILPLVFLTDATITLLARILSGRKPTQAHRDHFYQRAVLGGQTHHAIALRIMAANAGLVVLALISTRSPIPALVMAVAIVGLLLASLQMSARKPGA